MTTRWRMQQCSNCQRIWPLAVESCGVCRQWLARADEFDVVRVTAARNFDPDTSKLAAFELEPRIGTKRRQVLDAFRREGAMTARQAGDAAGVEGAWKRCSELHQGGHLAVVRVEVDPETGADVQVYRATSPGDGQLFGP